MEQPNAQEVSSLKGGLAGLADLVRGGQIPKWLWRRILLLAISALLLAGSTYWAFNRPFRDDAFAEPGVSDLDWWMHPVERNAYKRLPIVDTDLNDLYALDGKTAWIVGDGGLIIHTTDGGKTWVQDSVDFTLDLADEADESEQQDTLPPSPVGDLSSISDWLMPKAYAEEQPEPESKEDWLQQQTRQSLPPIDSPASQQYDNRMQQQAAEPPSGFATLSAEPKPVVPAPVNPDLNAIYFVDSDFGWIVGDQGVILATTDGGESWQRQYIETGEDLHSLFFLDEGSGAVGSDGQLYLREPGNDQWVPLIARPPDVILGFQFSEDLVVSLLTTSSVSVDTSREGYTSFEYDYRIVPLDFFFEDKSAAWVIDVNSGVHKTEDGGTTWDSVSNDGGDDLRALAELSAAKDWSIGNGRTSFDAVTATASIPGSEKRGGSSAATALIELNALHFADGESGWAVGPGGLLWRSEDGGESWTSQCIYSSGIVNTYFEDSENGVCVVYNSSSPSSGLTDSVEAQVWRTDDGGATWTISGTVEHEGPISSHFRSLDLGWIKDYSSLQLTTDGGVTWSIRTDTATIGAIAITFADDRNGWAVGFDGKIARTTDSGQSWEPVPELVSETLIDVFFADSSKGWIVGYRGVVLRTTDGDVWQVVRQPSAGFELTLSCVHFVDSLHGWAASWNGTIIATTDGGETWDEQRAGARSVFTDIYFVDRNNGWAVGLHAFLATSDGGRTWLPVPNAPRLTYTDIFFLDDGKHGWIGGSGRTIFGTSDGGATWEELIQHRSYPPPILYVLIVIAGVIALPAFRRMPQLEPETKSVADMLVSDRPIGKGDPDPLRLGEIAAALSRFLRNVKTEPPLTIAVTGEWGSGKSSLMNLLKADLEGWGFRPVWFNAWHHQKEEHLLAALLENIRAQAIPAMWRPEGIAFRIRLLCIRGKKYWFGALLLLLLLATSTAYFVKSPVERLTAARDFISNIIPFIEGTATETGLPETGSVVGILISIFAILRTAKAFRSKPSQLVSGWWARLTSVAGQPVTLGFRYRFSREFREITQALNPRSMLILIDDLDRCRPQNVTEVLEAINFLVSSGECFVVMGMDHDYVQRCVGLAFKDVAADLITPDQEAEVANSQDDEPSATVKNDDPESCSRENRRKFAEHYLGKLVNIEVPIPKPTAAQTEELMVTEKPSAEELREQFWKSVERTTTRIVKMAAVVALVVTGIWWGANVGTEDSEGPDVSAARVRSEQPATQSAETTQPESASVSRDSSEVAVAETDTTTVASVPGVLVPGRTDRNAIPVPYAVIVLAALVAVGLIRFSMLPNPRTTDSSLFEEAVRNWHPLIIATFNTPRFVKRFMNRVRYYAMCQRKHDVRRSVLRRIIDLFRFRELMKRRQEQTETGDDSIKEDLLVAMGAIEHCRADWLDDEDPVGLIRKFMEKQTSREVVGGNAHPAAMKLIRFLDSDPNLWPRIKEHLGQFRKLAGKVHIR